MCIVFYTLHQPGYRVILASNRDEYLDRPAIEASWHEFGPLSPPGRPEPDAGAWVLSGRDVGNAAAGTWLGMTSDLRIGVITNIRHPHVPTPPGAPSRGKLLKDFLAPSPSSPEKLGVHQYLQQYEPSADRYEGFNLLLLDVKGEPEVGYLTNRPSPTRRDLSPTFSGDTAPDDEVETHGLSNTPLDMPFVKVQEGRHTMARELKEWNQAGEGESALIERMMTLLSQSIPLTSLADAARSTLLQPMEVALNPEIPLKDGEKGRWYGTRVSTIILVRNDGSATFVERDRAVLVNGQVKAGSQRRYDFNSEPR